MDEIIITENSICLVDNHHGIYIPQLFAGQVLAGNYVVSGVEGKDLTDLATGPDHEEYWEIWEEVLDYAMIMVEGKEYFLHQDNDLWAIPKEEKTTYELNVCAECFAVIAGFDETEEDSQNAITEFCAEVGPGLWIIADIEEKNTFSRIPCECCRSRLAGERYAVSYEVL